MTLQQINFMQKKNKISHHIKNQPIKKNEKYVNKKMKQQNIRADLKILASGNWHSTLVNKE